MNTLKIFMVALGLFLGTSDCITAQIVYHPPKKKLVEFSHASPTTKQYLKNIALFDGGPFDGISVKLSKDVAAGNIFMVENWRTVTEEQKLSEYAVIESIAEKSKLEHNLLVLYGASQMDWFSDEDWLDVETQIRFGASLAKMGNFKGILWDPEPYKPGKNPWQYSEQPGTSEHSFYEYFIQVRKRGTQFMTAIQDEFPGLVLLSLRELSDYQDASPFSQAIVPVKDVHQAESSLEGAWWGLHLAFILGMLEVIDEEVTYIDANEEAYYYTSALEYFEVRNIINNEMRALIPPGLRNKFKANYHIGHAVSTDYVAGNWVGLNSFPYRLSAQGDVLTPEQKAHWFEHNVYYALKTSDEYVWLYTEKPNWWTGEKIPEGFYQALESARNKINNSEPLGFQIEEMMEEARDTAEKKYQNQWP